MAVIRHTVASEFFRMCCMVDSFEWMGMGEGHWQFETEHGQVTVEWG